MKNFGVARHIDPYNFDHSLARSFVYFKRFDCFSTSLGSEWYRLHGRDLHSYQCSEREGTSGRKEEGQGRVGERTMQRGREEGGNKKDVR